jgi:transcription antitermination factor NusG
MDQWYVVMTRPQMEGLVRVELVGMSFMAFLPMMQRYREVVVRPLFPRYLFVRTVMTARRWHMINGVRGVVRMLGEPGEPMPVRPDVMDGIIGMVGNDHVFLESAEILIRRFRPGQSLEVVHGLFKGSTGVCTWADKNGVRLEINPLLGRGLGLYVPLGYVSRVEEAEAAVPSDRVRSVATGHSEPTSPQQLGRSRRNPYRISRRKR